MIPLIALYNEYIDRPTLTEQKYPFEYIAPHPQRWVGTISTLLLNCSKIEISVQFFIFGNIIDIKLKRRDEKNNINFGLLRHEAYNNYKPKPYSAKKKTLFYL